MARLYLIGTDPAQAEEMHAVLTASGHECTVFDTGRRGMRATLAEPPDAALVDLYAPELDGIEFLMRTRREAETVKVIVMASYAMEAAVPMLATASLLGAAGCLVTPAQPEDLRTAVEATLERAEGPSEAAPLPTRFAPAERADEAVLTRQAGAVAADDLLAQVIAALPDMLLVLNEQRQVVFANKATLELVGMSQADVTGLRPGELLGCVHAHEEPGGCGTSESCRMCGLAHAILKAQKGRADVRDSRFSMGTSDARDFRVSTRPLVVAGEKLVAMSISDISSEKRREVLERVFFHDVLNTAGGLQGLAGLLQEAHADDRGEIVELLSKAAQQLVHEIRSQRLLSAAESGHYEGEETTVSVGEMIEEVIATRTVQAAEREVNLRVGRVPSSAEFTTDVALMGRVLGNLVKNAIEASSPGMTVEIMGVPCGDVMEFSVHNESVMPHDVALQVFQRSFSTKGAGRGLGTYSVKLFTERYLHGEVRFESSEGQGTTFIVRVPRDPVHEESPALTGAL